MKRPDRFVFATLAVAFLATLACEYYKTEGKGGQPTVVEKVIRIPETGKAGPDTQPDPESR